MSISSGLAISSILSSSNLYRMVISISSVHIQRVSPLPRRTYPASRITASPPTLPALTPPLLPPLPHAPPLPPAGYGYGCPVQRGSVHIHIQLQNRLTGQDMDKISRCVSSTAYLEQFAAYRSSCSLVLPFRALVSHEHAFIALGRPPLFVPTHMNNQFAKWTTFIT